MNFYDQERINNIKMKKMIDQDFCCAACGEKFTMSDKVELAHILPQRKWIIKKYGAEIIHHAMNMKATHAGDCNNDVQMSPNKTEAVDAHVKAIKQEISNERCLDL